MDYHQNARLTIHSREQMARKVLSTGCALCVAAIEFKVCPKTVAKWVRRYQAEGAAGLREWAYAKHWRNSDPRDAALRRWTDYYNRERPHGSLNYKPPLSRSPVGTTS